MLRFSIIAASLVFAIPAAAQTAAQLEAAAAVDVAASARTAVLKTTIAVTSGVVRIGDLVDNAGSAGKIAVFRAPDLGDTGAVPVSQVIEALRAHNIVGVETNGASEVVVRRESRAIPIEQFETRIARAFASYAGIDDYAKLSVLFDRETRIIQVEPSLRAEPRLVRASFEPRSGRFDAVFDFSDNASAGRAPLRFTGTVAEMVNVATLTRKVERGEIIKASDVSIKRQRKSELAGEQVASIDLAVGRAARSDFRAGRVLRSDDLMKPEWIQRNGAVTLLYEVPNIRVTMRGKALETGSEGDIISVTNFQSNRTVQGTVTGIGEVTVRGLGRVTASLVPAPETGAVSHPTNLATNLASAAPSVTSSSGTVSAE